ncbi:MAG TPA: hypothetical protein VLW55_05205 [Burkholderiaceae bacterium]|nr:hypothetical protein [Burkholderiaceae bacterium]
MRGNKTLPAGLGLLVGVALVSVPLMARANADEEKNISHLLSTKRGGDRESRT